VKARQGHFPHFVGAQGQDEPVAGKKHREGDDCYQPVIIKYQQGNEREIKESFEI